MAVKKSELYSSLWASCDELRGGMDASQYKDYVLVLLFVKYVSDKYAGQKDALIDVPKGGSFADMVALKGDKEIGDKMMKIVTKLAEKNGGSAPVGPRRRADRPSLGVPSAMVIDCVAFDGRTPRPLCSFASCRADAVWIVFLSRLCASHC